MLRKREVIPIPVDKRGEHDIHQKISQANTDNVRNHINSFPRYTSHYSRHRNLDREYLNLGLNLNQLHNLYCDECESHNGQPVEKWCYDKIFIEEFNLSFKKPSTDTCITCDRLQNILDIGDDPRHQDTETAKERHLERTEMARKALDDSMHAAGETPQKSSCIIFDFQKKTLPTPQLQTKKVFYLRQMWTYNLNVHGTATGKRNMFMWDEQTVHRDHEIASGLIKCCKNLPASVTKLTAFSGCCGGQNRNENIAMT